MEKTSDKKNNNKLLEYNNKKYPIKEVSLELIENAKLGDKKAREEIVENLSNLVFMIANSLNKGYNIVDDMIQNGYVSLLKAIENFDKKKGTDFIKYASACIKYDISSNMFYENIPFSVPKEAIDIYKKIKVYEKEFYRKNFRNPSINELSSGLNIKLKKICEVANLINIKTMEYSEYEYGDIIDTEGKNYYVNDRTESSINYIEFSQNKTTINSLVELYNGLTNSEKKNLHDVGLLNKIK